MIKDMVNNKCLPLKQIDNTSIIWEDASFNSSGTFEKRMIDIMDKYGLIVDGNERNCSIITPENGDNDQKINYTGGKSHINGILQSRLFKQRSIKDHKIKRVEFYGKVFYEMDRVIRTKNDYSSSMKVNGDTGFIVGVEGHGKKQRFEIVYDDDPDETEQVSIKKLNDEFDLCYGMTIHKKQGDEDENIVVILSPHQYSWKPSSNNENVFNLIYTAISRAKKRCILLGDKATYENVYRNKDKKSSFYSSFLEIENE
jgi:ATP-dependent exoDNAse (exonuclease V) alpha subunit